MAPPRAAGKHRLFVALVLAVIGLVTSSLVALHPGLQADDAPPIARALARHGSGTAPSRRLGPAVPPHVDFAVVLVLWNPQNYSQRVARFRETLGRLERTDDAKAWVVAVELVYGANAFLIPRPVPPQRFSSMRFRLPAGEVSWCKERLVNLAVDALPRSVRFVAWVDSEVAFTNPLWVAQARWALAQHGFAQLFERVHFLGPRAEILDTERSLGAQLASGALWAEMDKNASHASKSQRPHFAHPGYAWAATRDALERTGGLLARTFGGADKHMAFALVHRANLSFFTPPLGRRQRALAANGSLARRAPEAYFAHVLRWQARAKAAGLRGFGVVPGALNHSWHGDIRNRAYLTRWKIIHAFALDPDAVFALNADGLDVWTAAASPMLRHMVAKHFAKRNEDRAQPLPPRWAKRSAADDADRGGDDDDDDDDDALNTR